MQPPWMEAIVGLTSPRPGSRHRGTRAGIARSISSWPGSASERVEVHADENIAPAPRNDDAEHLGVVRRGLERQPDLETSSPFIALRSPAG
jgi:hypothetical protein